MRAAKNMILRQIAGESILIPTGQAAQKIHGMISLSESASLLWQMLQQERTEEELVDGLLAEYEIDRQTAAADVRALLAQLEEIGALE